MSKIYEIKLTSYLRLLLFQSKALSFKQSWTEKTFSINQNEILSIIEGNDQKYLLWFEKNNLFHVLRLNKEDHGLIFAENRSVIEPGDRIPWKISKHLLAPAVCTFVAIIPTFYFASFLFSENLKPLFLSETCYAPCAKLMSELTSAVTLPYSIILGIPFFYLIGCFFAIKFFKFKINRPALFVLFFLAASFPFMSQTYDMFDKPNVRSTISHWKKGTLNLETISQIKTELRKDYARQRTAETSSSNTED